MLSPSFVGCHCQIMWKGLCLLMHIFLTKTSLKSADTWLTSSIDPANYLIIVTNKGHSHLSPVISLL